MKKKKIDKNVKTNLLSLKKLLNVESTVYVIFTTIYKFEVHIQHLSPIMNNR